MSITSVTGTGASNLPIGSLTGSAAPQTTGNSVLGEHDFLALLTTQLQNQNPLQPMDETQSIAELAQFSQLQETTNLATSFQNFQSSFSVTQFAGFIGKPVSVETATGGQNGGSLVNGIVNRVVVQNGQPYFTMTDANGNLMTDSGGNPMLFSPNQIVTVG
ncbi:flagellar hook capping protein [bacterium]|nr:MAG: flagellar hook capping protein [bacterium]